MRYRLIRPLTVFVLALGIAPFADASERPELMAEQAKPCAVCHGKQGRASADGYYPRIAGKPAQYLLNQLRNFKQGRRQYEPMTHLLQNMDDAYLQKIAHYFANLDLPWSAPVTSPPTKSNAANARRLINKGATSRKIPACTSCHAEDLMGDGYSIPPLLGLSADYINAQFGAWRNAIRKANHPDCMGKVANQLEPHEINDMAAWLAAQPVPAKTPRQRITDFAIQCADTQPAVVKPPAPVSPGQYLAQAGNCAGCHSAPGSPPYSGGRAIQTPFGRVWSTNLTPDMKTGLGQWTSDDFFVAMTQGISRDGHALYPAFPYPNYSGITRSDSDSLFTWLQTLPPANSPARENQLGFPYNTSAALWTWRELFFTPQPFEPDATKSAQYNRGAYLAEVLGHCSACHGKRNRFGAVADRARYGGATLPNDQWHSPSLLDPDRAGVQAMTTKEVVRFLGTGANAKAIANGPMADIVFDSLQHLNANDLTAMATYLKAVPIEPTEQNTAPRFARSSKPGQALYKEHCADCHGESGVNEKYPYPSLRANRAVTQHKLTNLISTTLRGGYLPVTKANPRPLGMPPFGPLLSDKEIAQVLTYVRSAFGNRAGAVFPSDVSRVR